MSIPKTKVVFLGDTSVGKSSILYRLKLNKFKVDQDSTIGCEFFAKEIERNDKKIKLLLWDTAGQEVFRSFTKNFLRGAKLVVIVYDVSSIQSFNSIESWLSEVKTGTNESVVVVTGNKSDLENKLDIDRRDISNTLKKCYENIHYFGNVSCKTGENIIELFNFISDILLNSDNYSISYNDDDIVRLNNTNDTKNSCCNI